ncbi:hypothetical protein F5Y15DRAFT_12495 [Xylariaceae sp. FL0016]|nr:hypothetical protein F5Y15DRAFT_12495 [Xylariaceae sp. FL0016]
MRAATFLAALAGASSASAAVFRIAATTISYDWDVTGWSAGCAESGCSYDFNITGAGNETSKPPRPGFMAYCTGQGEGADYQVCEQLDTEDNDARVVAKLLASNGTANGTGSAHIQVSLRYTDLETSTTWWNYTGDAFAPYNQFSTPGEEFTIRPDEVFGVA